MKSDLTFGDWLKSQPQATQDELLGVGRADLWRSGTITLQQLLDVRGVPMSLQQLTAKYGH